MKRVVFCGVMLLSVIFSQVSFAQESASLSGVVTDRSGAVISDASVRLQDTKTNATYETKTNSVGSYTFVKLLPGPGYRLVFTKDGFESLTVSEIYVGVGTTHTQNAVLQLGQVATTVEVSGSGEVVTLDTTDTIVGKNFDMRNVHDLPIQARSSPLALLDQLPGVVDTPNTNDDSNTSRSGAVTGSRTDQGNVTLDGLDINDFSTGQSFTTVGNAPVDSIQEFRAETANPLAASGRGSGVQVELVTKSGTNQWHGAAFDYLRNTVTEANDFFNDQVGLPTPKLNRNQFGANLGGPVIKDKLFFFFDFEGRRDAREDSVDSIVPLDSLRDGNISYVNDGAGCEPTSRINTAPQCITTLSNAQVLAAGLDPAAIGLNSGLLQFINSRYPHANDLSGGDGINTGGFRFNSPVGRSVNDYVGRVDYNLSDKMKLFGRFSILRDTGGDDRNFAAPIQFPGDPVTNEIIDTSYAYVIGHTWTISSTKVNQFFYGKTVSRLNFPVNFNPTGANNFKVFGPVTAPFASPQSQHRIIPIPVFRDDFTYIRGTHNIQMGGTFKPIKTTNIQVSDFNQITLGLGGQLLGLDASQRPDDILQDDQGVATTNWDTAFAFGLGRYASIFTNINNDHNLQPLPSLSGHNRQYRYYETEMYLQDTWRMRSDLTMTYGLRYQYYSVPYEIHGFEAVPNITPEEFLNSRIPLAVQGIAGPLPITTYDLAGKANHASGLYQPDWKDFAPRLAFAYNPSAKGNLLGRLLGDRKTVIRAGAGIVFDHTVANALNFIQDQNSYLFQNSVTTQPAGDLATDPRFTDISTLPPLDPPLPVTRPFAPFVDPDLGPIGTALGNSNFAVDPHLRTPYSITFSMGVQRELPGNFLVEATYFGRLGRRLLAQADFGQVINFVDPASGHTLAGDFADLSRQLRGGLDPFTTNPTPEPFFENQIGPGRTGFVARNAENLVTIGDLADTVQLLDAFQLSGFPGLQPGVGLAPQFGSNVFYTNKGYSNYNGLLMTLHKRTSHGLQFDINYTYSHSIDNVSAPANNIAGTLNLAGGVICDVLDLNKCRGNSDFDATHLISSTGIWDLPFGHGKRFGNSIPRWLDEVIGGWQFSGVQQWSTGFAFTTVTGAFPISFLNNAPAVFNGDTDAIKTNVHVTPSGQVQLFADKDRALAAFRSPLGLEGGTRNNLRGPHFSNFDLGVAKRFVLTERVTLQFRADAYNAFNHPNFGLPGGGGSGGTTDITNPDQFGVIKTVSSPRQMQFALRLEF